MQSPPIHRCLRPGNGGGQPTPWAGSRADSAPGRGREMSLRSCRNKGVGPGYPLPGRRAQMLYQAVRCARPRDRATPRSQAAFLRKWLAGAQQWPACQLGVVTASSRAIVGYQSRRPGSAKSSNKRCFPDPPPPKFGRRGQPPNCAAGLGFPTARGDAPRSRPRFANPEE
ncbi:hypothetical protein HRbin36_02148 [bacterium HR36]|nr:hypothetical protein HRbin36_02148 [bacterium HR36]